MKRRHIVTSLVATGLIAAGSMASTTASAGTHRLAKTAAVAYSPSKAAQAAALRYWTPARMRSAKNLDTLTRAGSPAKTSPLITKHGTPVAIPGSNAAGTSVANAITDVAHPAAFSYPFPFTRFTVTPYKLTKKFPRVMNGKVFFVQNATNYVCSGTSVASPNFNRVWTAGHCMSDGAGHFDTSVTFVPAYNGNAGTVDPRGTWAGTLFTTTSAWHNTGDFTYDLGSFDAIPLNGKSLGSKVGYEGFAYNQSADQQFVSFGYPQAAPFNGTVMTVCLGASAVRDAAVGGAAPQDPIGIGCDMTGGSSGGSWNIAWSEGGGGYINGHNDYKYGAQPLAMYSPYFDATANVIRCYGQPTGSFGC